MEAHEIAEHIHHSPHEHGHRDAPPDGLRKFAGIYLGVVAMLLAIATLGGGAATKELLSANIHASDTYAYYQAKYLRQVQYQTAADLLEAGFGAGNDKAQALIKHYRELAARYESEPATANGKKELLALAKHWEARRDEAAARNPNFEFAEALLQIAIVLGSVSIVASSRRLLGVSAMLALCGVALTANGFLLLVPLPHG
ncbi:MAG TPA: DUF4337 domain-containing protein [Stellaceae bacterium]|nr:DUF4337 domain-containing protein [Stellaceae bacterium]